MASGVVYVCAAPRPLQMTTKLEKFEDLELLGTSAGDCYTYWQASVLTSSSVAMLATYLGEMLCLFVAMCKMDTVASRVVVTWAADWTLLCMSGKD